MGQEFSFQNIIIEGCNHVARQQRKSLFLVYYYFPIFAILLLKVYMLLGLNLNCFDERVRH
jgi:hypothetical protein